MVRIETSLKNERKERERERRREKKPSLLAGLNWISRAAARHLSLDSLITVNQSRREFFIREFISISIDEVLQHRRET